jgi:hypothetical protein
MELKDALTTNISPEPIMAEVFLGGAAAVAIPLAITAAGVGATAISGIIAGAACADGDCTNEATAAAEALPVMQPATSEFSSILEGKGPQAALDYVIRTCYEPNWMEV